MKDSHHHQILSEIKAKSGKPTKHTFLNNYLGNQHPRYPIASPELRAIARSWARDNRDLDADDFAQVISDLVHGKSFTEKLMAGMLLDVSRKEQRKFDPRLFDEWLEQLEGWAEVDAMCTSKYTRTEIQAQWKDWKSLILKFSKSENIHKRRASLVLFCAPLSQITDEEMAGTVFQIIDRLKPEKSVLITKAISWVLRSMIKHHRELVDDYLKENSETLPRIAVRETLVKLKTGKKTSAKKANK